MEKNSLILRKTVFILIIFLSVSIFTSCASHSQKSLRYKIIFEGKEKMVSCVKNDNGILLLPLKEITQFIGYTDEECGRCGKDEVYSDNTKALDKGHVYVNWFKNVITFSNDARVVTLDANNERINGGITYTSMQLYKYIGLAVEMNEARKTITMTRQDTDSKQVESKQSNVGAVNGSQEFVLKKIIYAYDPSCSSCRKVTTLLKGYSEQYRISVDKIDVTSADSKSKLQVYYKECSVPDKLKGIYPMLFIGDQYLFDAEITSSNIESLLKGGSLTH